MAYGDSSLTAADRLLAREAPTSASVVVSGGSMSLLQSGRTESAKWTGADR